MRKDKKISHASPDMTFEQFFKKYYYWFLDYCLVRSLVGEPEDIVADAFVALWEHWEELNSHEEFVLIAWVKKAVSFVSMSNYQKRAKRPATVEFDENLDEYYPRATKDLQLSMEDRVVEEDAYQRYLADIRQRLSSKEWQLFDYMILQKLSIRETASKLGKSEKAVSVDITRLRAKLRKQILPKIFPDFSPTEE